MELDEYNDEMSDLKRQLNLSENIIKEYQMFHVWFKEDLIPMNKKWAEFNKVPLKDRISHLKKQTYA